MVLLAPRYESERLEQLATRRQALISTRAVARVSRLDGRTRIIAVRTAQGWQRGMRLRWTRDTVELLRSDTREVLLSRHLRRARVPLTWIPRGLAR